MRIGELSRRTGVDEQLLRYYEKQGLLHPERSSNGYRVYTQADVTAVLRIRELLAVGLTTAAIAEIGDCVRDEPPTPACDGVLARLASERSGLDKAIARLEAARATLDTIIDRRGPDPSPPSWPAPAST